MVDSAGPALKKLLKGIGIFSDIVKKPGGIGEFFGPEGLGKPGGIYSSIP
jgi:hypothetical protein